MIPKALLDTDTLSFVTKGVPRAIARERLYRVDQPRLTISAITRFQVERGYKYKRAAQLASFRQALASIDVVPLDDRVLDRASDLYADLRLVGIQIETADCLIAATAIVHGLTLVTNNTKHFDRIAGLHLENWLL